MKKITSLFVAMLLLLSSCGSVPLTGRKQVLLVSDQEVLSSSLTQYSDPQVNAFCMPGGKIVVYEGLMQLVSSDDELAVVVGHEVAHAVAKHSNERMSQQLMAQYGAQILGQALSNKSAAVQKIGASVYGLMPPVLMRLSSIYRR